MASSAQNGTVIELSDVWKIFGQNADAVLAEARTGTYSKQDLLERYDAVVGVADVSLDVRRGEIFCVMGQIGRAHV